MITINLEKARILGHGMRRALREQEFKPYDDIIAKQIPGPEAATAEASRQAIRDKYAVIQDQINSASTPEEIKTALGI